MDEPIDDDLIEGVRQHYYGAADTLGVEAADRFLARAITKLRRQVEALTEENQLLRNRLIPRSVK